MSSLPIVALIGRPNVGKSTLFNALLGKRKNLVMDEPGVTRDLHYERLKIKDRTFLLVDTGGLVQRGQSILQSAVKKQVLSILEDADCLVVLLDGREGLMAEDYDLVQMLRKQGKPIVFAVNKIDSEKQKELPYAFYALGVEIFPVSAEHKRGLEKLMDQVLSHLPLQSQEEERTPTDLVHLAILGRPNVGKSTLLNQLLGEERALVTPIPGTTRDSIESVLIYKDQHYRLVDTAGIRSKGKTKGLEGLSVRPRQNVPSFQLHHMQ